MVGVASLSQALKSCCKNGRWRFASSVQLSNHLPFTIAILTQLVQNVFEWTNHRTNRNFSPRPDRMLGDSTTASVLNTWSFRQCVRPLSYHDELCARLLPLLRKTAEPKEPEIESATTVRVHMLFCTDFFVGFDFHHASVKYYRSKHWSHPVTVQFSDINVGGDRWYNNERTVIWNYCLRATMHHVLANSCLALEQYRQYKPFRTSRKTRNSYYYGHIRAEGNISSFERWMLDSDNVMNTWKMQTHYMGMTLAC